MGALLGILTKRLHICKCIPLNCTYKSYTMFYHLTDNHPVLKEFISVNSIRYY